MRSGAKQRMQNTDESLTISGERKENTLQVAPLESRLQPDNKPILTCFISSYEKAKVRLIVRGINEKIW
jgi:hypothetical protein